MRKVIGVSVFMIVIFGTFYGMYQLDKKTNDAVDNINTVVEQMNKDVKDLQTRLTKVERDVSEYSGMISTIISNEEKLIQTSQDLNYSYAQLYE